MAKPIVVMKFGGTSVADASGRVHLINKVKNAISNGFSPVLVVSAMGRMGMPYATDTLLSLAPTLDAQGKDLLMGCGEIISACVVTSELNAAGILAFAMSGADAGLRTDGVFGNAQITGMDISRVQLALTKGAVPVITGFQGISPDNILTTLGRGGSDTSAVEIGGYLGAAHVDIYTDVPGVALCDPRIIPSAPYIDCMDSSDMLLLAEYGAKVVHPRAVSAAKAHNVPIWVKSTFDNLSGTLISHTPTKSNKLLGVAVLKSCAIVDSAEVNALQAGQKWALPLCGSHTIITALKEQPCEDELKKLSSVGELILSGRLIHLIVPDEQYVTAATAVYDILK